MGKRDRSRVVRRDDHPHPDMCLVEQLLGKIVGHPHAAVRGRVSGQRSAVQRDAVPGDALHVRHPGIVVHGRVVVLVLLDEGEDAGRRLASLDAGRHRRAIDPAIGVVVGDLLRADRHDRHDRLAGRPRRRLRFDLRRPRRCGGAGAQGRQRGHRRERRKDGRPPTAYRHGGLCRRQSMDHAKLSWIARLEGMSALASNSGVRSQLLNTPIRCWGLSARFGGKSPHIGRLSTKLSTTRFSPALSKWMVSLLPSTAVTLPLPNLWVETRRRRAAQRRCRSGLVRASATLRGRRPPITCAVHFWSASQWTMQSVPGPCWQSVPQP